MPCPSDASHGVGKKKARKTGLFSRSAPLLEWLDVDRLRTFGAAGALERHLLVFLQALEAAALDRREVREKILPAVIRSDEPETLGVVEPLYRACTHVTGLPKKIVKKRRLPACGSFKEREGRLSTARALQRTSDSTAWRILQGDLYRAVATESSRFDRGDRGAVNRPGL